MRGRGDLDEEEGFAVDVGEDGGDGLGGLEAVGFVVDDLHHVGVDFFIFGRADGGLGALGLVYYLAGFEEVGVAALVVGY